MESLQCYYNIRYQLIFGTNFAQHGYTGLFRLTTLVGNGLIGWSWLTLTSVHLSQNRGLHGDAKCT